MAQENITVIRLCELLGSHFTVMTYTWGCHWNVVGADFKATHEFLKELYESEQDRVDAVAERIRALGSVCPNSVKEMELRTLVSDSELDVENHGVTSVWAGLAHLWEKMIGIIAYAYTSISEDDIATKSFLESMTEEMQKELWMIKSNLG